MIPLINFLKKRPSDLTIRLWRIIFGLILILAWYYNLIIQGDEIQSSLFWQALNTNWILYVKYIIIALWFIPLFMWITNCCLLKKKYMRIIQIVFGIILFYISSIIIEWPDLDFDSLIWFMWILPFLAWITWKCITTKCIKYKEVIKKIRV